MKNRLAVVVVTVLVLLALGAVAIAAGAYNVAADEPHSGLVLGILEAARERSIAVRAAGIKVPGLDDPAMAGRGAGNYDAMCVECHLAPGAADSELSAGLYPAPPNLATHSHGDAAEAFWIIKHGIKATGMPAWGRRMEDQYIWELVAFLRKLPSLSAEQYAAEVASSGGHSHGGGESAEHSHAEGEHDHEQAPHSGVLESGPVSAVQSLHEAMSAGDARRVESLLDAQVLIMEGGNVERSRSEYASHHLAADLKFMKGLTYRLERQTGDTVGDLAWVASEARINGTREGKPTDVSSTETLVLKKSAAGWKVVHVHWSSRAAGK
jgi:ketosteroid isomerase-like protein/mono/diheme cytochrome c family protein